MDLFHSFILDLGNNGDLYFVPKILKDSASMKRKIGEEFNLNFFYPYKIEAIVYAKKGKKKIYGKYNGRLWANKRE